VASSLPLPDDRFGPRKTVLNGEEPRTSWKREGVCDQPFKGIYPLLAQKDPVLGGHGTPTSAMEKDKPVKEGIRRGKEKKKQGQTWDNVQYKRK